MAKFTIRAECLVEFLVEAESLDAAIDLDCEVLDTQPIEVYQMIEGEEI